MLLSQKKFPHCSSKNNPLGSRHLKSQTGQVIIEYVLLLSFVAVIAVFLISSLARRGETIEDSGIFIKKWHALRLAIGRDEPISK
jgi:hypothetical protein